MVVAAYNGHRIGKFWVRVEERLPDDPTPAVRVRHTVDDQGNYYEETLTQEEAFRLGLALMRDYSLSKFGHG